MNKTDPPPPASPPRPERLRRMTRRDIRRLDDHPHDIKLGRKSRYDLYVDRDTEEVWMVRKRDHQAECDPDEIYVAAGCSLNASERPPRHLVRQHRIRSGLPHRLTHDLAATHSRADVRYLATRRGGKRAKSQLLECDRILQSAA